MMPNLRVQFGIQTVSLLFSVKRPMGERVFSPGIQDIRVKKPTRRSYAG
jgi:hypothetical protein